MGKYTVFYLGLLVLGVNSMGGCTTIPSHPSTALPSSAFFIVDGAELKPLQAIAHAQEARMKNCHKGLACEDAYYVRGLVALFENRADAITIFQELRTVMPNSRYDASAIGWLNLLQDKAPVSSYNKALLGQLRQEIIQNLLERSEPMLGATKEQGRHVAELTR